MFDIHCHFLPGVDDGPGCLEDSLALARQAVDNGVTHAVVTPHIHHGRWDNNIANIRLQTLVFREALAKADIDLKIACAAEVRIAPELMLMHQKDEIPMLGQWQGKDVMLLELPHSHIPPGTDKIVRWLIDRGVLPMIAHPERNKDIMRTLEKIEPFVEMGCLFQVTAGSVIGQFGERAQERAYQLLESGVVTVLASDAHHTQRRPVNLFEGFEETKALLGSDYAWRLVRENPKTIAGAKFG